MTTHDKAASPAATEEEGAGSNRRCVIIVGMHRSGTSALTRVLSLCGLGLPANLVPANEGNLRGHWESEPICRFNDRLLALMGLHWISWQSPIRALSSLPERNELLNEASSLLESEFGTECDFVLKDPRICRLIPFWSEVMAAEHIQPVFVLAYRHPLEVGQSLESRNGILPAYGMLAWLRFMLDAERYSRGQTRYMIGFKHLIEDWRSVIENLRSSLANDGVKAVVPDAEAIEAFLTSDLHHAVANEKHLPSWIEVANEVFLRWICAGEDPRDYDKLDAIDAALNAADPMFADIVEPTDRIRELEAALYASHNAIAEYERQLSQLDSIREITALVGRLDAATANLREASACLLQPD